MGKRGNKSRGLSEQYRHTSIFVTPKDWDKINFLADGDNKTVSRYILDTIFAEDRQPSEYIPEQERIRKSICLKEDEREKIKALADKYNMSVSNYILGMIL